MYIYDIDCYVWCYDIGGYVWDNFELLFDLWLWYLFLCIGDLIIFYLVENMICYNCDVDIYYVGEFKGLGICYNVQYWGCSVKQLCISIVVYCCFYYYIIGDDCIGDVLNEVINVDKVLGVLNFICKVVWENFMLGMVKIGVGIDWGLMVVNWLIVWECIGDMQYCDCLVVVMKEIGEYLFGFFVGVFGYDVDV